MEVSQATSTDNDDEAMKLSFPSNPKPSTLNPKP